ncbi:MAG: hypothetical protein V7647_378 [Acidobacteriota bacterium]|jgi:hypothetical protein
MTTLDRLRGWKLAGVIDDVQYASLSELVRGERLSVYVELSAALYVGVLLLVGGLGWTIRTYFTNLGDPFVIATLSLIFAGSVAYCLRHAAPYAHTQVESPNLAFDYVLYLGCLALSVLVGYLAFRFEWARQHSDNGLLATVGVFAVLAYRFDNRFVLSLALTSLAGWFGLKLPAFGFTSPDALRLSAITYGAIVAATGAALYRQAIKPHFFEAYLHIAANAVFSAFVSGASAGQSHGLYLIGLVVLSLSAIGLGVRFRRFAFVAYGTVYGYAGITRAVLPHLGSATAFLAYFFITGTLVIVTLAVLARRFGRTE